MRHHGLASGTAVAGKYVVERPLGHGGMGAVYAVSHAQTGKRMAMKTLLPEFVEDADIVSRFLREAQVMGRLHHRHVVDVFDVGRDGDVLYIVMELLEGKPLSDLLADSTLTLEEALAILIRAMEGVASAHEQGVVHRDLKPDNIFVCVGTSGRLDDPRVLDFGISKVDDPRGERLTRSGVAMGTPYYMSIEQLSGQRDLDARVDVYAMGVILYEAIAGEPPFMADSMSALAIRVLTTEPLHLGKLRPDLPPGLADLVMKAVARNRDERPRSMRALIEALRPFLSRSAGLAVPEGQGRLLRTPRSGAEAVGQPALLRTTPQGSRTKSSLGLWAGVCVVLALGGAGATVMLRQPPPPPAAAAAPALPSVEQPEPVVVKPTAVVVPDASIMAPAPEPEVKRALRGRKKSAPEIAVQEPPKPAPAPAQPPPAAAGNARRTAEGRAGKLGSDEF
ncbi:MAG TPA: serine/threonine-protein kinase [Polyangiales bacterium]|nr:serine/threonine-protein kinase [Polyangiales bacterium]